jgi:hypothetical protein
MTIFVGPTTFTDTDVPGHSCDINLTQSGSQADGRDQAAHFAAGDKIYFYKIGTSPIPNSALLASKSSSSPTLPSGYSTFQGHGGPVILDGSGFMRQQTQIFSGGSVEVFFDAAINECLVLSGGTAVNSSPTTAIDCSGIVPSEAAKMSFLAQSVGSSGQVLRLGYVQGEPHIAAVDDLIAFTVPTAQSGETIYYAYNAGGASAYVFVTGWKA